MNAAAPAGGRRNLVGYLCLAHAALFLALALGTWRISLSLGLPCFALCFAHALNALAALVRPARLANTWLALSVLSLLFLAALGALWFGAIGYLSALYDGLGFDLVCALAAVFGLALALTLPIAAWGLAEALSGARSGHERGKPARAAAWGNAALALCCGVPAAFAFGGYRAGHAAPVAPLPAAAAEREGVLRELAAVQRALPRGSGRVPALLEAKAVRCPAPVAPGSITLVATFVTRERRGPRLRSVCIQAPELSAAVAQLAQALRAKARRAPVTIDLVRAVHVLGGAFAWLDALKLRPGLDGACQGTECLMPWQLLSQGFFSTFRPVPAIPDFQFGVEPERLWQALQAPALSHSLAGLTRIVTDSYVVDGELVPLARLRRRDVPVSEASLQRASIAAEEHILEAQLADGKFRYTLDPFSGVADTEAFNLPRQAGVTLVLCELGSGSERVAQAIQRSLGLLSGFEQRSAQQSALGYAAGEPLWLLASNALPLVAFVRCSERVGLSFDPISGRLADFVLGLQRTDGSFDPAYDSHTSQVVQGREPMYATGQALLALLLLEARQRTRPSVELPALERLRDAAERAMRFYGTQYWSHPLRDFFFLEENWHCLAARAALTVHRNADYERFCLDYVRFKSRLILAAGSGVAADFDGGFGFGNIVPPHNTGAAGLGEALAAALAIQAQAGADLRANEEPLVRVLGFLLRQQWAPENCFACASRAVWGGLSEHTHSATTRIDFIQHAWAAWGHGGRQLGLLPRSY